MKREDVFAEVQQLIEKIMRLSPDEISEEKELCNDLKMDFIDGTELVIECEKQFNISISDELWESVETVEDVVDVIILKK